MDTYTYMVSKFANSLWKQSIDGEGRVAWENCDRICFCILVHYCVTEC